MTVSSPKLLIACTSVGAVRSCSAPCRKPRRRSSAYLIVNECRCSSATRKSGGTKSPDYGRVVGICTGSAIRNWWGRRAGRDHPDPGRVFLGRSPARFHCGPSRPASFGQHHSNGAVLGATPRDDRDELATTSGTPARAARSTRHRDGRQGRRPLKDTAGPPSTPLKVMNMWPCSACSHAGLRKQVVDTVEHRREKRVFDWQTHEYFPWTAPASRGDVV